METYPNRAGIDFTICNPKTIEISNCIQARQDRGISTRMSEGSGVIEKWKF